MDVMGNAPISNQGVSFVRTVWDWHPLWKYCEKTAPDIIPSGNLGYFNDGWGLGKKASLALADRLAAALASGETRAYEERYRARLETLPPEVCTTCGGTGHRANPSKRGSGSQHCNVCRGTGKVPDFETNYPFTAETVREFEAFLRDCGGFRIC
jgi:hypothetical protein